ncbi:MAG: tRNA glutamyl-Q(34) synthetase GluQRS [Acidimicrobiales bacterium]
MSGRYAPSPTGDLHVGNLRTAMVAWLFARRTGRAFLMRMEDLDDTARRELGGQQLRDLEALGIDWDGPIVYQSDRLDHYNHHIDALIDTGLTYRCYCSRREIREAASAPHGDPMPDGAYPGTCRNLAEAECRRREADGRAPALRLHAQVDAVDFVDGLAGSSRAMVDDFVIRRRDGVPAYNLAVVVDDADMGVDQVVRGDDLLPSTPRHLHLADLLGVDRPEYAHVPLVHNDAGERLAKRDGAVTLTELAAIGHPPSAVRAWLAHSLGLAAATEPVSMADLLDRFDPQQLPSEPWVFTRPPDRFEP